MNLDLQIAKTSRRLTLVRLTNSILIALNPILWLALFFVLKRYIGFLPSAFLGAVAFFVSGYFFYKYLRNRPSLEETAALALDKTLDTKERFLSWATLKKDGDDVYSKQVGSVIEKQLHALNLPEIDPRKIIPIQLDIETKRSLLFSVPALFALVLILILGAKVDPVQASDVANELRNVVINNEDLPEALKEEIKDLADTIDSDPSDIEAIEEALTKAETELDKALEAKESDESQNGGSTVEETKEDTKPIGAPSPTPTSTPTPIPNPDQKSEKDKSEDKDASSESDKQKSESGDQGEQGSEKSDSKNDSKSQEQKDGKQGEGEGEGDGDQKQKEGGKGSKEGKEGDKGSKGESGKAEGDSQGDSKDGAQSQEGSSDGKGEEKSDGKEGDKGSEGSTGNSGMNQAAQALSKARQDLEKQKNQDQKGDGDKGSEENKSTDQKKDGNSSEGSSGKGEKGQKPESKDGKSGGKGEGNKDDAKNEPQDQKQDPNPSGDSPDASLSGKDEEKQNPENKQGEQRALPRPSEQDPQERELPEGPDTGDFFGPNKKYEEKVIDANDEKLDTRFTDQTGKFTKNDKESEAKVSLGDVTLAKPDPVRDRAEQPIPLEYKDVLK